jgi:hypothetical protein
MGAINRINKSPLSQRSKSVLRNALTEKITTKALLADVTSIASLNTTMVDIADTASESTVLSVPVRAYATYLVTANLSGTCTTNNGMKLGLTGPTADFIRGRSLDDATYALYDAFTDVVTEAAAAGTALNGWFQFVYRPTADGNIRCQFAESTNHADTITVKAGSFLRVEEISGVYQP